MRTPSRRDPWQPVHGDEIGPTRAQRARSAVVLFAVLVALGGACAAGLGLLVLALLTLAGVSIG